MGLLNEIFSEAYIKGGTRADVLLTPDKSDKKGEATAEPTEGKKPGETKSAKAAP